MKKTVLNKFDEFILEKNINESILYLSPKFKNILNDINSKASQDILNMEGSDLDTNITLIDIDDDYEHLTFSKIENTYSELNSLSSKFDNDLANKLYFSNLTTDVKKNKIKIGRFIKKIIPYYSDTDVEKLTNDIKSFKNNLNFYIVEGDDIAKYYNRGSDLILKGTLGYSCMNNVSKIWLEIYTENEESCRLLILLNKDKQLVGRALLWKIESDLNTNYYMDKQYVTDDYMYNMFINYAIKNKWAYYKGGVYFDGDEYESIEMTVSIKSYEYEKFPYLDTFKYYYYDLDELRNKTIDGNSDYYILTNTDGGHDSEINSIYSDYYEYEISNDDGEIVYSSEVESYLLMDRSVLVDGIWYPNDGKYVAMDYYNRTYYRIEELLYLDRIDGYVHYESMLCGVITEISNDGEINYIADEEYTIHDLDDIVIRLDKDSTWFKTLSKKYKEYLDAEFIINELLTTYKNELWPTCLIKDVYHYNKYYDNVKIEYLTELDAEILGIKIDNYPLSKIDVFSYYEKTKKINQILSNKIEELLINTDYTSGKKYTYKFENRLTELENKTFEK